jgi:hypothetical protein
MNRIFLAYFMFYKVSHNPDLTTSVCEVLVGVCNSWQILIKPGTNIHALATYFISLRAIFYHRVH